MLIIKLAANATQNWVFCIRSQLHNNVLHVKVQLTPKYFLHLMKTTSFLYYFSEKIISIDKIPPILQAFKVVISCPTTDHGGIWVGPLLTSSKDIAQNTQETFDGVSSAVKTYLGYLCLMFCWNCTRLPNERSVSSTIQYGVYLRLARLRYIYFFSISKCGSPVGSATLPVTINNLPAILAWKGQNHGWRVNLQLSRSY